jgi:hypothetical protein
MLYVSLLILLIELIVWKWLNYGQKIVLWLRQHGGTSLALLRLRRKDF